MAIVSWGEWKPDVSSYNGGHTQLIENVFPRGDGYGPVGNLSAFTDALPAACRGAFLALDDDGTIAIFAGTSTKLYKMNNTSLAWEEVTRANATELDYTSSTNIGDMSAAGGLTAAFDGTTAQAAAACAAKSSATSAYVGKTLATAAVISSVKIYGSNDAGYVSGANPGMTVTLYGKTGTAPANATDGTSLGSTTFTDTADESSARTITSTSTSEWLHTWVTFAQDGSAATMNVAELEFFSVENYSLTAASQWQFAQSGTDVVAVATGNAPQRYTLGTSVRFAALAGSPPQASYATMVNGFLVLSGLTSNPFRIAWSALNNIAGWTAGTNGSDVQDFPDGGIVRGVAGGEFGWVFQDNATRRMTFVGGDVNFEFDRLTEDRGLRAPYSLIRGGDKVYFLSADGFCELSPSGLIIPIGREKFDRTFYEEWDTGSTQLMVGAYDSRNNRVHWFYKSTTGASGLFDKGIVYDPALQRAAPLEISGEFACTLASPGVTLDGLDTLGFTSIDALGISLDDFPASTNIALGLFNSSHQGAFLSGDNLEATLETPQMALHDGARRYFVRGSRPDTDAATVYGSIFTRQKLTDVETQSGETLMNDTGYTPHRVDGRVTKLRNRIPAATSWSYSIGVEPDVVQTGKR